MDARFRREEFKYCDVANIGDNAALPSNGGEIRRCWRKENPSSTKPDE